jgi:hypothetical protein
MGWIMDENGALLACGFNKDSKCSDDDTERFLVGPYLGLPYILAWLNGGGGAFAFDLIRDMLLHQRGVLF